MGKGLYSYNTKEWQPLVGCRNDLPCVSRCWAHRTVRRTVKCLERDHLTDLALPAQRRIRACGTKSTSERRR